MFYHCDQHRNLYKHPNLHELRGSHDYNYSNQSSTSIIRPKNIYSTYGTQIPLPANRRAFVSGRSQDVDMERYLISNHICILHVMSRVPLGLYRDYQYLMNRTHILELQFNDPIDLMHRVCGLETCWRGIWILCSNLFFRNVFSSSPPIPLHQFEAIMETASEEDLQYLFMQYILSLHCKSEIISCPKELRYHSFIQCTLFVSVCKDSINWNS